MFFCLQGVVTKGSEFFVRVCDASGSACFCDGRRGADGCGAARWRGEGGGLRAVAQWFMGETGYEVRVIEPVAQADRAIAAVASVTETLSKALAMLDRVQRVRVAA